jgi:glycosyltransferase involved in cell wall biosynthesis
MTAATSVIIPCYNGEKYLPAALESVRTQTVAVREIVVVDDGSTVPLRAPEGWQGPPLHIHRTPNRGLAAARNFAISHATGEFVALLDSDDLWHPSKIEEQERALRGEPTAVASYTQCVDAPGFFGFGPYPPEYVSDEEFLLMLWYHSFFPPSAVLVRRDALQAVGPFREDLGNGEDIEMSLRLLTRGRFVQVARPLCYYRIHEGQFTKNIYRKVIGGKNARAAMLAQHADRLVRAGLPADTLWDAYRNDILLVYFRRQFPAARYLLWNFWRDHPTDLQMLRYALLSLLPGNILRSLRGKVSASPQKAAAGDAAAWKRGYAQLPKSAARNPSVAHLHNCDETNATLC